MTTNNVKYCPYKILGLDENADIGQIKKRYRILATKYHPDSAPTSKHAEKVFDLSTRAYKTLLEKNKLQKKTIQKPDKLVHSFDVKKTAAWQKRQVNNKRSYYKNGITDLDYNDFIDEIRGNFFNFLKVVTKIRKNDQKKRSTLR